MVISWWRAKGNPQVCSSSVLKGTRRWAPGQPSWLDRTERFSLGHEIDTLYASGWWPIDDGIGDVSDLAIFAGGLYALSDESESINLLVADLDEHRLVIERTWRIARAVGDPVDSNPEGLCFLPDRTCYVAYDRDQGNVNLGHFDPFRDSCQRQRATTHGGNSPFPP